MTNIEEGNSDLKHEELELKKLELKLKKRELEAKNEETDSVHKIENRKILANFLSVVVAGLAVAGSIYSAASNIQSQQLLSREQATLAFQIKVAELALADARNTGQVKERALALADLFGPSPLISASFAKDFDATKFKLNIGQSIETREKLIALFAQHPNQRAQILKDWYVMFWWQSWWVEPLLEADIAEKKRLDDIRSQIITNETRLK